MISLLPTSPSAVEKNPTPFWIDVATAGASINGFKITCSQNAFVGLFSGKQNDPVNGASATAGVAVTLQPISY